MKTGLTRLIGPLVLIAGSGYSMAEASPADTPGTVALSPAMMAAPVPPMTAAEAASTTEVAPAAPAAAAPSAPPAAAAAATATVPAAPGSSAAPAPAATSAEEETLAIRKAARLLGLKPRNKAGTEVYCKSSAEIGTRVPTLNCYTKEQIPLMQRNSQSNKDDVATLQRLSLTEPNKF